MEKSLTIKTDKINSIITKAGDIKSLTFKTIDQKALAEIESFMPEVNRAVSSFQKQNSQTTTSLMSLNMIDSGPYRVLRQILAQIETKRTALKDNLYRIEKNKLKCLKLERDIENESDDLTLDELNLKRNKLICDIVDAQGPIEASLKELGALKRRYEEVKRNNNIPDDWSEDDFEKAEIEHHIKSIFRNAIRDRMQGSHNMGTMEYMEQYSINPIVAYALVDKFIKDINDIISKGKLPDIQIYYNFYEDMYNTFKNEYVKGMKKLGLDSITYSDFLFKG